jgi:hypothetical protein
MTTTKPNYTATITDYLIVEIRNSTELIDWTGPWSDRQSAEEWANAMVLDLNNGIDHYGNQEKA